MCQRARLVNDVCALQTPLRPLQGNLCGWLSLAPVPSRWAGMTSGFDLCLPLSRVVNTRNARLYNIWPILLFLFPIIPV